MPDVSHVDAYLMGPARFDLNLQQSEILMSPGYFEDGMRGTARAAREYRHSSSIAGAASDPRLDLASIPGYSPIDQRRVRLVDLPIAKLI